MATFIYYIFLNLLRKYRITSHKKMQIKWLKKIKQFDMAYLLLKMISI